MNIKSKIVIAASLIGMVSIGFAKPAKADDVRSYRDCSAYYYEGCVRRYYRDNYYYNNYHNSSNNDSDDAAWAIGGLVVGAIVGAAANQQQVNKQKPTPAQVVRLCTETIKTDVHGNTVTERTCRDELVQ